MAEIIEDKSSTKARRKKSKSKIKEEEYEMEETNPEHMGKKQMAIGSLLFATSNGDGAQVLRLLRSGDVGVNDGDYDKRTALHIATCEGHLEIVKSLISAGANVNCADRWGATPLDEATRHGQDEIADYLRQNGGNHGANTDFGLDLVNAASKGDLETVKRLVKSGISVKTGDYDRRTPLHVAVAERHLDVIQFLLDNGAEVDALDRFGGTPLQEAERVKTRLGDDPVLELLKSKAGVDPHSFSYGHYSSRFRNVFVMFVAFWEVVFGILFAIFMTYDHDNDGRQARALGKETVTELYGFYMDVHVMIFIGFGFLMTFLRKYGYTSVGLNFLLGAFAVQWYLLVGPFFEKVFEGDFSEKIHLNIAQLIKADFAAGAVLITFGALLGKTSPVQMMAVALIEVFFYSINETIGLHLKITDLGGSMVIHLFGAYFGLAASFFLTPKGAKGNKDNSAVYRSDLFSMIGTIFLWIYWPSFNGAFGVGNTKHRAIVNTVISLCASCVVAFVASQFIRNEKKFNMVDVQNATLAGGVAMGTSADLVIHPSVAILIGGFAGFVSVLGFRFIQPFVEKRLKIHDTCGVNNLHGMPGIIGAIAGVIASSVADNDLYGCRDPYPPGATALGCSNFADPTSTTFFPDSGQLFDIFPDRITRSASRQAGIQLAYFAITLGIALSSGALTGFLLRNLAPAKRYFLDDENWEVPELETPYYFDRRGEIIREHTHELEHEKSPSKSSSVAGQSQLEARLMSLERGMREMAEAKVKEMSGGGVGVGSATTVLLLQSLTEKVDKLLAKE